MGSAGPAGSGSSDAKLVPLDKSASSSTVPTNAPERRAQSAAPQGSSSMVSAGTTPAGANNSRGRLSGDSRGSEWAPVRKRVAEDRRSRMESLAQQVPTPQRSPDLHCRPTRDGDAPSRLLQAPDAGRDMARVSKTLRPVSAGDAG